MKTGILRIGKVDSNVISRVQENLNMIFPRSTFKLVAEAVEVPEEAFNEKRGQYNSNHILRLVRENAEKEEKADKILGIADIDLFVPNLNFVFGEAECPGRAALISLWRLRPRFYGQPVNLSLFVERSTKESVHELGHTLSLRHCSNKSCVMYFSNSILETDRKQSLFCNKCFPVVEKLIDNMGH